MYVCVRVCVASAITHRISFPRCSAVSALGCSALASSGARSTGAQQFRLSDLSRFVAALELALRSSVTPAHGRLVHSGAQFVQHCGARPHFDRKSSVFVLLHAFVVAIVAVIVIAVVVSSSIPLSFVSALLGGG